MTPERRKVVLICAAVACMSGGVVLLRNHTLLLGLWIALQMTMLVYALTQFVKLKRQTL